MTVSINGTNGLTFNDGSTQTTSPFTGGFGFRNRIINGAMVIDQRNAGASITPAGGGYGCDRWKFELSQSSKLTAQRSTTAPTGFINSQLVTSSSAYSVLTGDYFAVGQLIEGLNVSDLAWGTASAATVTLSFWVRSSLTGTFGGALSNSAQNRSYPFTYTITAANTWELETVTIPGDTSGTWLTDTGVGIRVYFGLGTGATYSGTAGAWAASALVTATGATSVVGTNGATFYVTGVDLQKGSTATSFDYRPYGTELALCQSYFERLPAGGYPAVGVRTTDWYGYIQWQTQKRAAPTVTLNGTINIVGSVGDINTQTPTGIDQATTKTARIYRTGGSFTSQAGTFYVPNYIDVSAEL
jgi:hypothetical protein